MKTQKEERCHYCQSKKVVGWMNGKNVCSDCHIIFRRTKASMTPTRTIKNPKEYFKWRERRRVLLKLRKKIQTANYSTEEILNLKRRMLRNKKKHIDYSKPFR